MLPRTDAVIHLYLVDLLDERGCMLMMGQSVASFPGVAIPPPAKGVSRMEVRVGSRLGHSARPTPPPHPTSPATFPLQLRQFKLVLWPLERDKFQVSLTSQSNLGFGSRLPAQLVEYMIKKGAGNMFRKLLDEATALQQAPRRNPYAKMLRREKGYYEHLARRLSRYLSALAD